MFSSIKDAVKIIPGVKWLLFQINNIRISRETDKEKLFTQYYEKNVWKNGESKSGEGSTIKYTENIRKELPVLFNEQGITSVLDAPCGDFNWFKLINRGDMQYIGGDIVKSIVANNERIYRDANTSFIHIDITKNELPDVDLWLCRDCLFHFSDEDIFLVLKNFMASNIEFLLTSTHPESELNENIPTGSFRLLNLEKPPFNLGKPILSINDWVDGYEVRILSLWNRSDIQHALELNGKI